MNRKETALEYVRCFCRGDVTALGELLSEDFRLTGPFLQGVSKTEYLDILRADPSEPCEFTVINIFEGDGEKDGGDGGEVALFWEYQKPEFTLLMAQLCRFSGGRISEILLVFDSGKFA